MTAPGEVQSVHGRLPIPLYEALRLAVYRESTRTHRISQNDIIVRALTHELQDYLPADE